MQGAASGRPEPAAAVATDLERVLVAGSQLDEVAIRLLEVIAEDLLKLDGAVAVDPVRPGDEPLVE